MSDEFHDHYDWMRLRSERNRLVADNEKLKAEVEAWHKGGRYLALEKERDSLRSRVEALEKVAEAAKDAYEIELEGVHYCLRENVRGVSCASCDLGDALDALDKKEQG